VASRTALLNRWRDNLAAWAIPERITRTVFFFFPSGWPAR